jgi:hypothetical protein
MTIQDICIPGYSKRCEPYLRLSESRRIGNTGSRPPIRVTISLITSFLFPLGGSNSIRNLWPQLQYIAVERAWGGNGGTGLSQGIAYLPICFLTRSPARGIGPSTARLSTLHFQLFVSATGQRPQSPLNSSNLEPTDSFHIQPFRVVILSDLSRDLSPFLVPRYLTCPYSRLLFVLFGDQVIAVEPFGADADPWISFAPNR